MNLTCAYCDRAFTTERRRQCCDRRCAAKLARVTRGQAPWETDAELWLELNAGTLPLPSLLKAFHRTQRRRGWNPRSDEAVRLKLNRSNLSRKCTEDNLSRYELARVLGIHSDRVRRWNRQGLPYRKVARNQCAIKVRDLKQWLLQNPHEGRDMDPLGLETLIGPSAAAVVLSAEHDVRGCRRAVVCIDTGEVFDGLKAAGRAKYVSHKSISGAIARGGRSAGYRWAWLEDLQLAAHRSHRLS